MAIHNCAHKEIIALIDHWTITVFDALDIARQNAVRVSKRELKLEKILEDAHYPLCVKLLHSKSNHMNTRTNMAS